MAIFQYKTDKNNIIRAYEENESTAVKIYLIDKIAELTISAGIVEWVFKKAS